MLNYVSGSTHYLSGETLREKEGCRLYQLGAISDSESAVVITTDMAEILAIWLLLL